MANNFIYNYYYTLGLKYCVLIADKIEASPAAFVSKENENTLTINEVLPATYIITIATKITTVRQ